MCVKSLVDKSAFEVIADDCPHLRNMCNTLEQILIHRIQRMLNFSSSFPTLPLTSYLLLPPLQAFINFVHVSAVVCTFEVVHLYSV